MAARLRECWPSGNIALSFLKRAHVSVETSCRGTPEFKEDDIALADWYTHTLNKLGIAIEYYHHEGRGFSGEL